MGGERDMARLTKPKLAYPVLAQRPVKKMFPKIYLERIETSYKGGQYSDHNLQAYALILSDVGYPVRRHFRPTH